MKLVLVHGRAQENKDPNLLLKEWIDSLEYGLSKSNLKLPIAASSISLPYYGDALFHFSEGGDQDGKAVAKGGEAESRMLEYQAEALQEICESAGIQVPSGLDAGDVTKGPQNWGWVQAAVRAIDDRFPGFTGLVIREILNDVWIYTNREGISAAINDIVQKAVSEEPTVVVAHSLGTVVAYNVLRRDPRALHIPKFITLGSPLGIKTIRRLLVPLKAPKTPEWFNAYDKRDIVALQPLEFKMSTAIENYDKVDNFTDNCHGISGYLSDYTVARKIYDALC